MCPQEMKMLGLNNGGSSKPISVSGSLAKESSTNISTSLNGHNRALSTTTTVLSTATTSNGSNQQHLPGDERKGIKSKNFFDMICSTSEMKTGFSGTYL